MKFGILMHFGLLNPMGQKKQQFIHTVNVNRSKTAKVIKKLILLSITLTCRQCDGDCCHLFMIFAVPGLR